MTSRFARLSIAKQIIGIAILCLLPTVILPLTAQAQTVQNKQSLVFEINNVPSIPNVNDIQNMTNPPVLPPAPTPAQIAAAQEQIFEQNVATLQDYLESKGSPLADHAETLLKQDNWQLVLAISNGESTLCKHQAYNNCWGIGGAWNLKRYKTLDDGITDVSQLLTNKYVAMGAATPEEIVNRYVGHANANWVYAVNKILTEVNNLPLVN